LQDGNHGWVTSSRVACLEAGLYLSEAVRGQC
jgi:hypothetical protein